MTEKERMITGKIYDPSDEELLILRTKAHRLSKEYNELFETDQRRSEIIFTFHVIIRIPHFLIILPILPWKNLLLL